MEIRNNTNIARPSFQANVEQALVNKVRSDAAKVSNETLNRINSQFGFIRNWGDKGSLITSVFDTPDGTQYLVLINNGMSSMYGGTIPIKKGNLVEAFLNLRKKDVIKAEQEIADNVENNKLDLIAKAANDNALLERITGKVSPTDEEFAAAIDRLSEEEITNLRFGLDNKPAETGNLIDFEI